MVIALESLLDQALAARSALFDPQHQTAIRLFNGFLEGRPSLVIDLYASTIVLHNYADPPEMAELGREDLELTQRFLRQRLTWVKTIILKTRHSATQQEKQGIVVDGETADRKIREHGVWYAVDLTMNRDASFYLDTRNLRRWALDNLKDKSVLNTFAYTGSLGVAAQAGGAAQVVHLDRNRVFLNLAKTSYTLNGFPIDKKDFQVGDFFPQINRFKRAGERFDCVFLDPPFSSTTQKGVVDLEQNFPKLINKVRPLINDNGYLIAINNALFLSGADYLAMLEALCADGYLKIEELIPVPEDFTGYSQTRAGSSVTDPAPFNHSTKIAILRVRRKKDNQE